MKYLIKRTNENVRGYQKIGNKGHEAICTVADLQDFHNKVEELESNDFFPQEDGIVLNSAGNEVFDTNYPNDFDFGDYIYYMIDAEDLDHYGDAHIINAIKQFNN